MKNQILKIITEAKKPISISDIAKLANLEEKSTIIVPFIKKLTNDGTVGFDTVKSSTPYGKSHRLYYLKSKIETTQEQLFYHKNM